MGTQILLLLGALFLVLLNGFFVAAEFAIVKVRATKMRELAEKGSWRAALAQTVIHHLDAYLSATQLGITIASLGLGWIGEPAIAHMLEPLFRKMGIGSEAAIHATALGIAFALISFLHIVLGELAPKSLAISKPEATSLWVAAPLRLFYYLMYPAIVVLNGAANWCLRLFGLTPATEGEASAHSAEELRMIVGASHAHGILNATERALLENVFDFSERHAGEIMIPRPDMVCLFTTRPFAENLAIVHDHLHTRYPLATDDKDKIVGMVHVKDLLALAEKGVKEVKLESIQRPILFVPETASLDQLLKTFQRGHAHMAVVVDEYGSARGIVTLEDVLEELVGPIRDEFDAEERGIETRGGEAIVDAILPLEEAAKTFGFDVPEDAHVHTIGGYVLKLLGRLPKPGESVTVGGQHRVEVAAMEGNRIRTLRFKPLVAAAAAAAGAGAGAGAGGAGAGAGAGTGAGPAPRASSEERVKL